MRREKLSTAVSVTQLKGICVKQVPPVICNIVNTKASRRLLLVWHKSCRNVESFDVPLLLAAYECAYLQSAGAATSTKVIQSSPFYESYQKQRPPSPRSGYDNNDVTITGAGEE